MVIDPRTFHNLKLRYTSKHLYKTRRLGYNMVIFFQICWNRIRTLPRNADTGIFHEFFSITEKPPKANLCPDMIGNELTKLGLKRNQNCRKSQVQHTILTGIPLPRCIILQQESKFRGLKSLERGNFHSTSTALTTLL